MALNPSRNFILPRTPYTRYPYAAGGGAGLGAGLYYDSDYFYPYYNNRALPYTDQTYSSYTNWARRDSINAKTTGIPYYSYYKPELYNKNNRSYTPHNNLTSSYFNMGYNYPYDVDPRRYLRASRMSQSRNDQPGDERNVMRRVVSRTPRKTAAPVQPSKSGRKSILKNSTENQYHRAESPALTNRSLNNDDVDDYFKKDDFNSNAVEDVFVNNNNNNNGDDNFIVNEEGRLTKMKPSEVPMKSANIHEYLYSLANKDNEPGYLDKRKESIRRRSVWKLNKSQLEKYNRFKESQGFGLDFLDPSLSKETYDQKNDKVKKRNKYGDYVRERNTIMFSKATKYNNEGYSSKVPSLPDLQPKYSNKDTRYSRTSY